MEQLRQSLRVTHFEYNGDEFELPQLDNPFSLHYKKRLQDIQYNRIEDKHSWLHPVK